jgi:hypothetical protein
MLLGGFLQLRRSVAKENTRCSSSSDNMRRDSDTTTSSKWINSHLPFQGLWCEDSKTDRDKQRIGKLYHHSKPIIKEDDDPNNKQQIGFYDFISSPSLIPPTQFLGWHAKGTQVWARLRLAGLEVLPVFSWDLKQVLLKVRCPEWRLEEVAEKMHIRLKTRNGEYKRFKISHRDSYIANSQGCIFRSSDRQAIIDFILRSKIKDGGAELDESSDLGSAVLQRFPLHMASRVLEFQHTWVQFWKTEKRGEIPIPWSPVTQPLSKTFQKLWDATLVIYNGVLNQPLDDIAEYFGDGIAFYFAWVAYFSRWLVIPAVIGFVVFCCQMAAGTMDHWTCIPFSCFIIIWASFMLAFWRQKSSALAYRWGVLGYEMEETERPQFVGKSVYDPSTEEMRKVTTPWERIKIYCVVVPIILSLVIAMLLLMTIIILSQETMIQKYNRGETLTIVPTMNILTFHSASSMFWNTSAYIEEDYSNGIRFPSITEATKSEFWMSTFYYPTIYGILVAVAAGIVGRVAIYLNNFENHRKQSTYINRLILKIFCFRFVAVFTPVFYYAFWLPNSEVR